MKKTIIFTWLILALTCNLLAQNSVNNFSIENNKIIWQKVFETNLNFNQLTDIIKESGIIEKIELGEYKILGELKPTEADFRGAGYSEMSTPIYIARSFFEGFVIIEFKDRKYRVTLKNIMLTQKYDDVLSKQGEKTTIETFGLKSEKNEFKGAFTKSPSNI